MNLEVMKAPSITYKFEAFRGRVVRPARSIHIAGLRVMHRPAVIVPDEPKWQDVIRNLVTTAGKNDMLDKYFAGSAYTAAWYVGLIDNTSWSAVAAGDTMASHSGWVESTAYTEGTREVVAFSAASAASKAASGPTEFTINATVTIRGAFLASNSTKGGTTGILYSAAAFSGTRALVLNDLLRVTPTYSLT